ncbi:hypothetical protein [Phenylobacterium sp.]|uniref:hypothetical protein n=1 Tax=Phenylobacterium sp. TaxID=1871053 RepID=UPI00286E1CBA|nr:hypothetical protein [Phenylobacterium sp.]
MAKILDDLVALAESNDEGVSRVAPNEDVLSGPAVQLRIITERFDDVVLGISGRILIVAEVRQIFYRIWKRIGLPYLYSMWASSIILRNLLIWIA